MSVVTLREPFATFYKELSTFQFTVSQGRIEANGGFWLNGLPALDHDDAVQLARDMNDAVRPILKRLADRKLAEIMPEAEVVSRKPSWLRLQ